MFIGRKKELRLLNEHYNSQKSELVVLYGRRRIGKSSLVKEFAQDKHYFFSFEGIEGLGQKEAIIHFSQELYKQTDDPILQDLTFKSWEQCFTYVTDRIVNRQGRRKKAIIFFDELSWMATGRSALISLIKYYWDNLWKSKNIMLILCGSIASFMIKKVINSQALYGRTTLEIFLKGLSPDEAKNFFSRKKSKEEILKTLLVFGGVPKYLELINQNQSFIYNVNRLCFSANSVMIKEIDKIFYSQFREGKTYQAIIELVKERLISLQDIAHKLHMSSGGGLKQYLANLEQAEFIRSYVPFNKKENSKLKKYFLSDEYIQFYFKYIEPHKKLINEGNSEALFERLTDDSITTWFGFAFEKFCIKHAMYLAKKMGFNDQVMNYGPYFEREDTAFQIDLLYKRKDKVITICEMKYYTKPITTGVIPEVERKIKLLKIPRGYSVETALISLYGPDKALRDTHYFNYTPTLEDLL